MSLYSVTLSDAGGSIDLDLRRPISWPFVTGGSSPRVPFYLPSSGADFLSDSVTLNFSGPDANFTVSRLRSLGRARSIGPDTILYYLVDSRYEFSGLMVDTLFNSMRTANRRKRPPGEPHTAQFRDVPKRTFIRPTCKSSTGPRFFSSFSYDGFEPWNSYDALLWLLSEDGYGRTLLSKPSFWPSTDTSDVPSRRFETLKNWNPRSSWSEAVNDLLRRSRLGLYVNELGSFVLIDLEPKSSDFDGLGIHQGQGGVPIFQDLSNSAPSSLSLHFPKLQEIRWDYSEETDFNAWDVSQLPNGANSRKFRLINVFRMPQDVDHDSGALVDALVGSVDKTLQKGQWVPANVALNAWKADKKNYPSTLNKNLPPYALETIRRTMLNKSLAHFTQIDYKRVGFMNPVSEARVSTIYNYYRRVFKIPDFWLDHIEDWRLTRVEVFDTFTYKMVPTQPWMDYMSIDSVLANLPATASLGFDPLQGTPLAYSRSHGIRFTDNHDNLFGPGWSPIQKDGKSKNKGLHGPKANPIRGLAAAPCVVNMLDKAQGVFGISFPTDLSGEVSSYHPGCPRPDTIPNIEWVARDQVLLGKMRLAEAYRFSIILSIRWKSPNSTQRFHTQTEAGADYLPEANGPPAERFLSRINAGYAWSDDANITPRLVVSGMSVPSPTELLTNPEILDEYAKAEATRTYFNFENRVIGSFSAGGFDPRKPRGNIASVSYNLTGSSSETWSSAESLPATPRVWEFLSPSVRNILGRFTEDTP